MSVPKFCFIGLDDPNNTPLIYAQILQEEIRGQVGHKGSLTRFNPDANRRQKLLDFMRCRPENVFIILGPTELVAERYTLFYKFTETWTNVSRDQLTLLLEYEARSLQDTKTPPPTAEPSDIPSPPALRRYREQ